MRGGDYDDAVSLRRAWEGAERILLVSSNSAASGGDPLAQHRKAIEVAREIGVGRLLYTSQASASEDSLFPPARDDAATEAMMAGSGLAWTALRHGFEGASALGMNGRGFSQVEHSGPEDGKVAWTTHDDLAEAAAWLLAGEEKIDGATPPLAGSESFDLADLARLASAVMCRVIAREVVSEDETERRARQNGVPEGTIAMMLSNFRAAHAGEFDGAGPTVARLLGRNPVAMRDVLADASL